MENEHAVHWVLTFLFLETVISLNIIQFFQVEILSVNISSINGNCMHKTLSTVLEIFLPLCSQVHSLLRTLGL